MSAYGILKVVYVIYLVILTQNMQAVKLIRKEEVVHVISYETLSCHGPAKSKHVWLLVHLKQTILQREVVVHKSIGLNKNFTTIV